MAVCRGLRPKWMVVWQRYPELTLHAAPVSSVGKVGKERRIMDAMPVRYAYDVAFAPQLGLYVVAGSTGDAGFIALVDRTGEVIALQRGLPPMASESRLVVGNTAQPIAVYPVRPRGIAVALSPSAIEIAKVVDHPIPGTTRGTAGAFVAQIVSSLHALDGRVRDQPGYRSL